jgi:hypothetical protein
MADTLTQLTAKIQANLQDNGTLFTAATITAAVRQALNDLNRYAPLHLAETQATVDSQHEYELTDLSTLQVTDVLLDGANEYAVALPYDAYVEDARWFIRLRTLQPAGENIIIQYTRPHTVSGLDSSLDSTLSPELNTALIAGACYYCAMSRAATGIEANNVEPNVSATWMKLATMWATLFNGALSQARHQPTAKGEPGHALSWNDGQHDAQYP